MPDDLTARRDVFDVDEERALDALRVAWGDAYAVCFDNATGAGGLRWQAWQLGGERTMITGTTPDELNAAIRADCVRRDKA